MKKHLFIFAATLLALSSCTPEEEEDCNCGVITDDPIETNADGSLCYSLEIRNDCSGNLGSWCFDEDVWMDGNVGESFCISNVSKW